MAPETVLVCSSVSPEGAQGVEVPTAAIAVMSALAGRGSEFAPLVLDMRANPRRPRATVLASPAARRTESEVAALGGLSAAARGRLCFAALAGAPTGGELETPAAKERSIESVAHLADLAHGDIDVPALFVIADPVDFRRFLGAAVGCDSRAILISRSRSERSLLSLICFELQAERVPVKVWNQPFGFVPARRALAGLEPGGSSGVKAARLAATLGPGHRSPSSRQMRPFSAFRQEAGQALIAVLGIILAFVALALALVAIGGATTAKGRLQRAADLGAISAARSMHDDFVRLFLPAQLPGGAPNPAHLTKAEYISRAQAAGSTAVERNGSGAAARKVTFPDGESFAPLRVRVVLRGEIGVAGESGRARTGAVAEAEVAPVVVGGGGAGAGPAVASGGGYSGPLEYRQGKPMRPDVAAAFDQMAAAASAAGISLTVNSGFRSDAEQQALWNANPDPTWVARPGTSLHRCGTELDLGPSSAYSWLAANAGRFGFVKRYSWEPWHFGFENGPEPCSAEGDRVDAATSAKADGKANGERGLPGFVPGEYRAPLIAAAARHDVSAALLAAQLMAESNFNPRAVSSAGAQGIAQFMPATAASYGLSDPFDPIASIGAQARMMSELIAQFGSIELALAGYNAGPGAVSSCDCIPPYPETQAYVAKILGLLRGFGDLLAVEPALDVRLVD